MLVLRINMYIDTCLVKLYYLIDNGLNYYFCIGLFINHLMQPLLLLSLVGGVKGEQTLADRSKRVLRVVNHLW